MKLKLMLLIAAATLAFGISAAAEGNVAQTGGVGYLTLKDALSNAQTGSTITLLDNAVIEEGTLTVDKSVEIKGAANLGSTISNTQLKLSSDVTLELDGIHFTGTSAIIADSVINCGIVLENSLVEAAYKYGNFSRAAFIAGQSQYHDLKLDIQNNTILPYTTNDSFATGIFCWNKLTDGSIIKNNVFGSDKNQFTFAAIKLFNICENATLTISDNKFYGQTNYNILQFCWQHDYKCNVLFRSNAFYNCKKAIDLDPNTCDIKTISNTTILIDDGNTYDGAPLSSDNIASYAGTDTNCFKWITTSVSEAMKFTTVDDTTATAGSYFNVTKSLAGDEAYTTADVTFSGGEKNLSASLALPEISGSGDIAFSVLLLNAEDGITATVSFK